MSDQESGEQSSSGASANAPTETSGLNALEEFKQSVLQGVREMMAAGFSKIDEKLETKFAAYEKIIEGLFSN